MATTTTTTYHRHQTPSTTNKMTIMALLPVAGILLGLAGTTFTATIIALAVATPLLIIFSPVIVPAVLTMALAVAGFLAAGTFGITGLGSWWYLVNMGIRRSTVSSLEYVKEAIQDVGEYAGQKTKDLGEMIQQTAHEMGDQAQAQDGLDQVEVDGKEGAKVVMGVRNNNNNNNVDDEEYV